MLGFNKSKKENLEIVAKLIEWSQVKDLLAGPDEIIVTSSSKTLEELGIVLHSDLRRITLIPESSGIYWADSIAAIGENPLPFGGIELECSKVKIATREFITISGDIKMSVVQEGSRDFSEIIEDE